MTSRVIELFFALFVVNINNCLLEKVMEDVDSEFKFGGLEVEMENRSECYPVFREDTQKCVAILVVRTIIAVVSMLCCVFVIGLIILFKKFHFLPQRLILYLSIAAFLQSLLYATANFYISGRAAQGINTGLCVLQGYWTLFLDWMSFILVLCISFNVFWSAVFLKKTDSFEKFYIIIAIIVPAIICCFPFIGDSYGPAGLWCWISSERGGEVYVTGVILQFVLFYGPLWFFSIIMLISLAVVAVVLHQRRKKQLLGKLGTGGDVQQQNIWKDEIRPIIFFPVVYIVILIFPSINRLRLAAGHSDPTSGASFFLWFMHSITLTLHGTLYALLFAFDKQTASRIRWTNIKGAAISWRKESTKEYQVAKNQNRETFYRKAKKEVLPASGYE